MKLFIIVRSFISNKIYHLIIVETILEGLTFNSEYWAEVTIPAQSGFINSGIMFRTPGCSAPDTTFTLCLNLKTTNLELTELNLRLLSLNYDSDSNDVSATIVWQSSIAEAEFLVEWKKVNTSENYTFLSTSEQQVVLLLETDSIYKIMVHQEREDYIQFSITEELIIQTHRFKKYEEIESTNNSFTLTYILGSILVILVVVIIILIAFLKLLRPCYLRIINMRIEKERKKQVKDLIPHSDDFEINYEDLSLEIKLSQSYYTMVYKGHMKDEIVVIKTLKEDAPEFCKEILHKEINILKKIDHHPNIVKLMASCTKTNLPALVTNYCTNGNLLTFLRRFRKFGDLHSIADSHQELTFQIVDIKGYVKEHILTGPQLLMFAEQVAEALEFLSSVGIIHGDVAARNVLIDEEPKVKLSDFGHSCLNQTTAIQTRLTLRWTAPEILKTRILTSYADVWSYGILLWEIVTLGAHPYSGVEATQLYNLLNCNYRLDKPDTCSDELYALMQRCWQEIPQERPLFTYLKCQLLDMITRSLKILNLRCMKFQRTYRYSSADDTFADENCSYDQVDSSIVEDIIIEPLYSQGLH